MTHLIIYLFFAFACLKLQMSGQGGKTVFNTFQLELTPREMQNRVLLLEMILLLILFVK